MIEIEDLSNRLAAQSFNDADEYTIHQKANILFFARSSINAKVRSAVEKFKEEFGREKIGSEKTFTRIKLDGVSSRTRVMLFRELTALLEGRECSIPFSFHGW